MKLTRTMRIALSDLSGKENPLICFRAFPDSKNGLFFVVRIWASARALWRGLPDFKGAYGCVRTSTRYRVRPNRRLLYSKCAGTIDLCIGYLQPYVVAHEMTHAGLAWARRIGLDIHDKARSRKDSDVMAKDCGEEQLCYAMGRLYRTVNVICHDAGYYAIKRGHGGRLSRESGKVRSELRF